MWEPFSALPTDDETMSVFRRYGQKQNQNIRIGHDMSECVNGDCDVFALPLLLLEHTCIEKFDIDTYNRVAVFLARLIYFPARLVTVHSDECMVLRHLLVVPFENQSEERPLCLLDQYIIGSMLRGGYFLIEKRGQLYKGTHLLSARPVVGGESSLGNFPSTENRYNSQVCCHGNDDDVMERGPGLLR